MMNVAKSGAGPEGTKEKLMLGKAPCRTNLWIRCQFSSMTLKSFEIYVAGRKVLARIHSGGVSTSSYEFMQPFVAADIRGCSLCRSVSPTMRGEASITLRQGVGIPVRFGVFHFRAPALTNISAFIEKICSRISSLRLRIGGGERVERLTLLEERWAGNMYSTAVECAYLFMSDIVVARLQWRISSPNLSEGATELSVACPWHVRVVRCCPFVGISRCKDISNSFSHT